MDRHRLDQRLADREARVQRGIGVLEHHLQPPPHRQPLGLAELQQILRGRVTRALGAAEQRRAVHRPPPGLVQAQQRQSGGGLA